MKNKVKYSMLLILFLSVLSSCESEAEKKQREDKQEQQRIELEIQKKQEAEELAFQEEQERIEKEQIEEENRIEREAKLEQERKEKAIYDKYIKNSLRTGSAPYSYCFGENRACSDWGCSTISVRTPSSSDVLVTIKKGDKVYRHAYIAAGSTYSFQMPNGTYQPFFYYGKGWNPNKVMKQTSCGALKGGFITNENFGKDSPQSLTNSELSYELILQQNGNFSTRPSDSDEAF